LSFPATLIDIPTHGDDFGLLGVLETNSAVPFEIKRVYFIYAVPSDVSRGAHGHKKLKQLIVPVSGSFEVVLHDGSNERTFILDSPSKGLLLEPGLWRNLINFSADAVCMVLASQHFSEADYIRDFTEFVEWAGKR
jgi:dTDP-4-dehydrorhamnose 3,5-epimerase-like enzyme